MLVYMQCVISQDTRGRSRLLRGRRDACQPNLDLLLALHCKMHGQNNPGISCCWGPLFFFFWFFHIIPFCSFWSSAYTFEDINYQQGMILRQKTSCSEEGIFLAHLDFQTLCMLFTVVSSFSFMLLNCWTSQKKKDEIISKMLRL